VGRGNVKIERIVSRDGYEEFAHLPFQVYANREAWWPPDVQNEIDLLSRRTQFAAYLEIEAFTARRDGRLVARVIAVINRRYIEHWNEQLGQLIHFEALDGEDDAAAALLREAVERLGRRGMRAVRSGFAAFLDYPYAIDNYGRLPSFLLRGNPSYYHRYFKNAGFETEKGQTDYTAPLTAALLERYRAMVAGAAAAGVEIRSWREYGFLAAIDAWTDITNHAFARHWGWNPVTRVEVRPMLMSLWETPVADLSMLAISAGDVVGAVFSVPDLSRTLAQVRRGAKLAAERGGGTRGALINVGVREARSFLRMAEQGMRYAGYTLVLDDNWASRRTAESLGAHITNNFVTYRRNL
jgi:hypothetical protein